MFAHPLVREIAVVLLVKLALIFGLYFAFFHQPERGELTGHEVSRALLGSDGNRPRPVSKP